MRLSSVDCSKSVNSVEITTDANTSTLVKRAADNNGRTDKYCCLCDVSVELFHRNTQTDCHGSCWTRRLQARRIGAAR